MISAGLVADQQLDMYSLAIYPMRATCADHLILLDLIVLTTGGDYKL